MDRATLRELGVSEEAIEKIMADYAKGIQSEKAKQEGLKADSLKLSELTKQLQAMKDAQSVNEKTIEEKDSKYAELEKQLADMQKELKNKEMKADLAEKGIVGDNADKLIESLNSGSFNVDLLGQIIADRENSAVEAKVKELTDNATNPNGGSAGNASGNEKTDAEKMAENIGESLALGNKASADVLANYI